jgi:NAD(P)-dependent dehydrogenase (short-subunit alcohol dehydrogenase family)
MPIDAKQPLNIEEIMSLTFPTDLLAGRVVLVTGAGDGIGRAAAVAYGRHGARVILAGKTVPKLETTYDLIQEAQKANEIDAEPTIYPIDFAGAEEQDYDQMSITIEEGMGGLDGILHNAGVLGARRPISGYYLSDWDACMQVNLRSAFLLTKAMLPVLERSSAGRIIFTSSSVGRKARAHWGAYAVSKFATEGLMQVLSDEMDGVSPICVNSIDPGATRTQMRARAYPAENPASVAPPEAHMPLYLYLMSDLSEGVNGQAFSAQPK